MFLGVMEDSVHTGQGKLCDLFDIRSDALRQMMGDVDLVRCIRGRIGRLNRREDLRYFI